MTDMKKYLRFLTPVILIAGVMAGFTACGEGGNGGGSGVLCAINGTWTGTQTGELTVTVAGLSSFEQTNPIDVPFGFKVENCVAVAIPNGLAISIDEDVVTISQTINNESYGDQKWIYTGTLNGAKDTITGTWTMSSSISVAGQTALTSGNGTFEVSLQ